MSEKNENRKRPLPTQIMLTLRGFIGFYLLYLAVGLIRDESGGAPRMLVMVFAVIFAIAGTFLVAWIIRSFIRGEYVGGKADVSDEMENTETEE
ncbi:MAG: hypothetical protein KIG50_01790 [Lachnospiraceae bacterium]|nr:hypothetical protein [Lachnospiraceae bacterium]